MKFCTIFILALLILSSHTQSCANAANPEDRIQSGSLQITTSYTPQTAKTVGRQRENAFTVLFKIPAPSGYQIVASFSEYSLTSAASNSQDFSIGAVPLTQSSAKIVVLIDDDGTWTKIKVGYLVTARIDFFLGTFVGDGYFKPKNSNGELLFSYSIPLWNSQSSSATAIALISGLRVITADLPLLKISSAKLNTTSGRVEVAIAYNSTNSFQYIQISYICFLSTSTLKFNRFDPAIPATSPYQIVFMDSFANKKGGFNGISFEGGNLLNCNGANCANPCILNEKCKSDNGVVSGNNCFFCPNKATWNGTACICSTGFYNISNSCLPCDPNSVYNATAQTCDCKEGFFGNYQLCTACDPSCLTCRQAGANGCLSCRPDTSLVIGACRAPCTAGTFRQGPICMACPSYCQTCSSSSNCTQCQTGYFSSQSGVCISSTPTSKIHLAGSIDSNRVIFQGVAIDQMPAAIKLTNCDVCYNLFLVNVTIPGVSVSRSVDYIVDSQYWFVITFDYGAAEARAFNFTVQIDPTYKGLFTQADMNQKLSGSIDPSMYPSFSDAVLVKPTVGTNQISQSAGKPGTGSVKPNVPVTQIKTNASNPIQLPKGRLSTDSATVKAIFG